MRSIWRGTLSFGLLNIPVNLYSATHEHELKFVLLHKRDLSQIRYARFCKEEEKEIPYKDIVKGYELEKGKYVVLSDEDFEKANPEKSKTIEIIKFTNDNEIDSIYYDKPYYLEPDKRAEKAYALLQQALQKSKKVAVAKYILKNHEHLCTVKPYQNALILNQMRFHSEILSIDDLHLPGNQKITGKEMEMTLTLIDHLTESFHPEDYKNSYIEELKEIIKKKSKGRRIESKMKEAPKSSKVYDIMSLLKASLEEQSHKSKVKKSKTKAK